MGRSVDVENTVSNVVGYTLVDEAMLPVVQHSGVKVVLTNLSEVPANVYGSPSLSPVDKLYKASPERVMRVTPFVQKTFDIVLSRPVVGGKSTFDHLQSLRQYGHQVHPPPVNHRSPRAVSCLPTGCQLPITSSRWFPLPGVCVRRRRARYLILGLQLLVGSRRDCREGQ
jgi:hypothetical protein